MELTDPGLPQRNPSSGAWEKAGTMTVDTAILTSGGTSPACPDMAFTVEVAQQWLSPEEGQARLKESSSRW